MYLPSPVPFLMDQQLIEQDWVPVHRITDLPPVGVTVLLRIEQPDPTSDTFTPLIRYYAGYVSRLVYGMKERPDEPGHFDAVAVPECFIETAAGPVCVPDLTIKAWTFFEGNASWQFFTDETNFPPLGRPVLVREHRLLKTRDYYYDLYYLAYPIQLLRGHERIGDERSAFDDEEKSRVLLSVPHPDPEKTKVLYLDRLEYRPLTLPEPNLLL